MKKLILIVHKQWFDLIKSGEKKEEYRDLTAYWCKRLLKDWPYGSIDDFKEFDVVEFCSGYQKDRPTFLIECKGLEIGTGREDWGAQGDMLYFKIKLGELLK